MKSRPTHQEYTHGIITGDRVMLGKAITLIESNLSSDQQLASEVIQSILPKTGNAIRIGITGVPGVGKSTFIESFGNYITTLGKKVAVLTIDPSSQLTRGSILGDKTRMESLAKNPNAFIRPSASGDSLGGVANKTRETILVCEAAGYDVIIVETVGVGQSEVAVKNMVDFFLLLMLAGAGDELQGIKKGIMEMADTIVITKADGENIKKANQARADYAHALHLFRAQESGWVPGVLTCSALENKGIDAVWEVVEKFHHHMNINNWFMKNRSQQNIHWFKELFQFFLKQELFASPDHSKKYYALEKSVGENKISPTQAAMELLRVFINR